MSVGEMVVMNSALGVPYDGFGTGRGGPINAGGNDGVFMLEATMVLPLV